MFAKYVQDYTDIIRSKICVVILFLIDFYEFLQLFLFRHQNNILIRIYFFSKFCKCVKVALREIRILYLNGKCIIVINEITDNSLFYILYLMIVKIISLYHQLLRLMIQNLE